jgi:4'-phosphopantetheinyl transferase EntD
VLELILPAGVAVAARRDDPPDASPLGREAEIVAGSVEKRRREFGTARACARDALGRLGVPPREILSGPRGEPLWPAGVVGSITHCEGYRGCAVGRRSEFAAIGIDAEVDAALPHGLLGDIALPEEQRALAALAREDPGPSWDRLLFSIKESVYKAWFPLAGRWLGFEDALVAIDRRRGSFEARLLVPGPRLEGREQKAFEGRWLARDGFLLAAIALAAPASGSRLAGDGVRGEE